MKELIMQTIVIGVAVGMMWAGFLTGKRAGKEQALNELRADLDKTVDEWNKRGEAGEVGRYVELPGIHVVRRMLGTSI